MLLAKIAGRAEVGHIVAPDGGVFVLGTFDPGGDFDPGEGVALRTCHGLACEFLLRLRGDGSFAWVRTTDDADSDGDVDLLDAARFQNCFAGASGTTCDPGCDVFDLIPQNALDLADFGALHALLTGPR